MASEYGEDQSHQSSRAQSPSISRESADVNERTSLLSGSGAHTSPEPTPAQSSDAENNQRLIAKVDPLHQKSARVYRAVLIVLFCAALFWLSLLSVDQLISVGVGATQGSGFESFTVTLLGVLSIAATLTFYKSPSPSDRTLNLLCVFFLVVDMLLISLVEQLRRRIGVLPMLFSFGGCAIACLLGSFSDTVVQHAREEEQERILGHSSTHRSFLEWVGVIASNILRTGFLFLVILLSINLIFDASDSHTAVGSLVRVGGLPDGNGNDGTLIHIACSPAGVDGPVAIIEAGETSGEDMHEWVQRARGLKAVCYWDRPGFGLSDNAPSPLAIEATISYLYAALESELSNFKDERLLLISHGVGSLYSRVFANKVSDQLAGLMLIDAQHEEYFYSEQTALHGLREFIRGITAPLSLQKIGGVIRGLGAEDRLFGLLTFTQARLHKSLLQQQVSANRKSALDISLASASLPGDIPILVVSSAQSCLDKTWSRYQRLLLKLSERVVAWKILDGPHNLWWNTRARRELTSQLESFASYIKNN